MVRQADHKMLFPNATLYVNENDHAFWTSADIRGKAPEEFRGFFDLAVNAIKPYAAAGKLSLYKDGAEFAAGVRAVACYGHTVGHSMVRVSPPGGDFLIFGDIVHCLALQFADPERSVAFDTDPPAALASATVLQRALRQLPVYSNRLQWSLPRWLGQSGVYLVRHALLRRALAELHHPVFDESLSIPPANPANAFNPCASDGYNCPFYNFLPAAGGSLYFVNPHLHTPYTYQYNLSLQHELARSLIAEVNYVGSSAKGLTASRKSWTSGRYPNRATARSSMRTLSKNLSEEQGSATHTSRSSVAFDIAEKTPSTSAGVMLPSGDMRITWRRRSFQRGWMRWPVCSREADRDHVRGGGAVEMPPIDDRGCNDRERMGGSGHHEFQTLNGASINAVPQGG